MTGGLIFTAGCTRSPPSPSPLFFCLFCSVRFVVPWEEFERVLKEMTPGPLLYWGFSQCRLYRWLVVWARAEQENRLNSVARSCGAKWDAEGGQQRSKQDDAAAVFRRWLGAKTTTTTTTTTTTKKKTTADRPTSDGVGWNSGRAGATRDSNRIISNSAQLPWIESATRLNGRRRRRQRPRNAKRNRGCCFGNVKGTKKPHSNKSTVK